MDQYFDLGTHTFPITTDSPDAQLWFDRGVAWCYGFHHEEAEACFRRAIEADPECAMAYWGAAYAAGPNYNMTWTAFVGDELTEMAERCFDAVQNAIAYIDNVSPLEDALIYALAQRFQAPDATDAEICGQWGDDYADAMRAIYKAYPNNPDICALTADSLMICSAWQLWDVNTGDPAEGSNTLEVKAMLETAMAELDEPHPGLNHLYIHLMEMSPTPEAALEASRELGELIPDSGHLRHMPSHIYVLCGLYEESLEANEIAHRVNQKYFDYAGGNNFYTLYRAHDIHFVMYSAMFLGQKQRALEAADEMAAMITPDLIEEGLAVFLNYMDGFSAMRWHAHIRFGEWQQIVDAPLPDDPEFFCVTTAMQHYAKGVAHAAMGDVAAAEDEVALFEQAYQRVPEEHMIFNNESRAILDVGREMLCGEIEYRKGNHETAYVHLRQSVALSDNMKYTEPWVWMQPTRHALAALLLEQDHVEEAAMVYRADLGLDGTLGRPFWHKNNVWSLHGYHECLTRMGDQAEAAAIKPGLEQALALADIAIESSCFCRTNTGCCDS